jgi:hypothetical protein
MKFILIIIQFFISSEIYASMIKKQALVRDEHFNPVIKEVLLTDLVSTHSFEGEHFKIVQGKNDEAIEFDESPEIQLKASTVYFHLTKAYRYYLDTVKSNYVKNLPQIIIRLELTNVFNEIGHFANDNLDPQFNNALSIPAGVGYEPKDIKPWGMEIWFRPVKEIHLSEMDPKGQSADIKSVIKYFRNQIHMSNLQTIITSIIYGKANNTTIDEAKLIRLLGTSILTELVYQFSGASAQLFEQNIYKLDSAMVPEIIYHEFSHIALSNHLQLTHSSPVNEGLADYFAGKIANSQKLATHIKEYNLFDGKQVRKKQLYNLAFERGEFANADFVFGLLWNLGDKVIKKNEPQFIYHMTERLSSSSSIRDELIDASLQTCKKYCANYFEDRLNIYTFFNARNF